MLVDFVFLCPSKKNFVWFVLGNREVVHNTQTKQTTFTYQANFIFH